MLITLPERKQSDAQDDPPGPAVRTENLSKCFGETPAVRNATFEVARGSLLALLGPSGGGKTTTLRIIAGFESPDSGTVEIDGRVVASAARSTPPEQRRVGMVFQDYALFPHLNVKQNVAFGVPRGPKHEAVVGSVLDMVGLAETAERMPHELSGGQQQRVALARALAPNPSVVLLDEPFSNLDASLRQRVRSEVRQILHEANTTAIIVTHDQDEAFGLADTVGIMLDNVLVQTGTPQQVYLYPASLQVAEFLGETNILDGEYASDQVRCELGVLSVGSARPPAGPVRVCVRPETLRLRPEEGPSVPATVTAVEFRGVYKIVTVRLNSGKHLSAVMGLHIPAAVGDSLTVGVNSFVAVFPCD